MLNGATYQTLVPAPSPGTRRIVRLVKITNQSGAAVTLTLSVYDGVTDSPIQYQMSMNVGDTYTCPDVIVLDTTTKIVQAKLSGAAVTQNPSYVTSWGDATS